ncbi:MAG: FAD-dependent oxidoreductase [Myxococcota bacterium]
MGKRGEILILGAGLTGLSAAYHLKKRWTILEKEREVGGLARSFAKEGFTFDIAGHWLHLRNKYIKGWITRLMGDELYTIGRRAHVFSNGVFSDYPYQINSYGLPPDIIAENLLGFFEARMRAASGKPAPPKNFADWILQNLGAGFAKNFMFPFNEKLWRTKLNKISAVWCDRFVPKPSPKEVIEGALFSRQYLGGYNATFSYPKRGGIARLPQAITSSLRNGQLLLNMPCVGINWREKTAYAEDGAEFKYDRLISTAPLKHLIGLLDNPPAEVKRAASLLKYASVLCFCLASKRYDAPGSHWVYFPEKKFNFYRVGSFTAVNPEMSPKGCHSLYVEISHLGEKTPQDELSAVIDGLTRAGIIRGEDDIIFAEPINIECAYVIMDKNYERATKTINRFLARNLIISTGRYGGWTYSAMEDALMDGKAVAEKIDEQGYNKRSAR